MVESVFVYSCAVIVIKGHYSSIPTVVSLRRYHHTQTHWCLFAACSCQTTNQSGEGEQGERGARRPGEEKKHFIPSIMNLSNYCEGVRVSVCVKSNWHLKKKKTTFWLTAASCCSETHICPWNITMHKCVCVCVCFKYQAPQKQFSCSMCLAHTVIIA